MWPDTTIEIFKDEILDKIVEVQFANEEEGTKKW